MKSLQKVVGAREDGHTGEQTLAAVRKFEGGVSTLIRAYCDERMRFLRSLSNPSTGFPVNGRAGPFVSPARIRKGCGRISPA